MKILRIWKTVFIVMGTISIILLIINRLTPAENTSIEMIASRPHYLLAALVFFVAAVIMDIIKAVVNEEQNK